MEICQTGPGVVSRDDTAVESIVDVPKEKSKKGRTLQERCDEIDLASDTSNARSGSSRGRKGIVPGMRKHSLSSKGEARVQEKAVPSTSDSNNNNNNNVVPSFEMHRSRGTLFCGNETHGRLTKGINVLSWDCGITNLCYCLLEEVEGEEEFRVKMWENFSLNSETLKQATRRLVRELDQRPWMMDVDHICIENQVLKNTTMKVICHNIQCYFETRIAGRNRENMAHAKLSNGVTISRHVAEGPTINLIKADSKFLVSTEEETKNKNNPELDLIVLPARIKKLAQRRRNKQAAVYISKEILSRRNDMMALNFLNSFNKQDDLSDALLQGLYYLRCLKKKRHNKDKLQTLMGVGKLSTLTIEQTRLSNVGTRDEELLEENGMNEGCEYEKEILLPQIYRSDNFVIPEYDNTKADISMITRYVRSNAKKIE